MEKIDPKILRGLPAGPREKILVRLPYSTLQDLCQDEKIGFSCRSSKFWEAKLQHDGYVIDDPNFDEWVSTLKVEDETDAEFLQSFYTGINLNRPGHIQDFLDYVDSTREMLHNKNYPNNEYKNLLVKLNKINKTEEERINRMEKVRMDMLFQHSIISLRLRKINEGKPPYLLLRLPIPHEDYDLKNLNDILSGITVSLNLNNKQNNFFFGDLVDIYIGDNMPIPDLVSKSREKIEKIVRRRFVRFTKLVKEGDIVRPLDSYKYYYIYMLKDGPYLAEIKEKSDVLYLPPQAISLILRTKPKSLEDLHDIIPSEYSLGFSYYNLKMKKLIYVPLDRESPNYEEIAKVAATPEELQKIEKY